jgi:hypothetical protein
LFTQDNFVSEHLKWTVILAVVISLFITAIYRSCSRVDYCVRFKTPKDVNINISIPKFDRSIATVQMV